MFSAPKMTTMLQSGCDDILTRVTHGQLRVPGVVAMITDRTQNVYQGAAGHR
jgi:methyl acetate hydrolase